MDYTVEDISPVEKKVYIKVSPEEVDAAIKAAAIVYQGQAQLDGFRKGKAPLNVIETKFHDQIYKDAKEDLINVHINDVFQKLDAVPVSSIKMSGDEKPFKKGTAYDYTMQFEIMPKFQLPNYEGLDVEQKSVNLTPQVIDRMLERLRLDKARIVPVEGNAPAKDGQIVNLDFEAFYDGKPLEGVKETNFELELGKHEALPEFEDFIKEIPVGHTAEKTIRFPEDFIAKDVAGKDVLMKATVHAIKERELPELNEAFYKSFGKNNLEELKKEVGDAYRKSMTKLYEAEAQQKLLEILKKQTDFQLPSSMVEAEKSYLAMDQSERLARMGKRAYDDEKSARRFVDSFEEPAKNRAREKIILLSVAKKENLDVPQKELETAVIHGALNLREDPQKYYDELQKSGLIFQLRDNLLCDKAMDLIYSRANVKVVDVPADQQADAAMEATPQNTSQDTPAEGTTGQEKA